MVDEEEQRHINLAFARLLQSVPDVKQASDDRLSPFKTRNVLDQSPYSQELAQSPQKQPNISEKVNAKIVESPDFFLS